MKKIFFILTVICSGALLFTSCEDKDKDPWVIHEDSANDGIFLTVAKETIVIDFTDPASAFSFTVNSPSNNVASYDLEVTRTSGGVVSDTVLLSSASSFPAEFNILSSDLATAFGLSSSDLVAGDRFDFIGTAIGTNGQVAAFENLNGDASGPGQFNAFSFNTYLSCPFNQADAIGTYSTTVDEFGLAVDTFEVTAGPDANSVIISDLIEPGFSMIMEVNPNTGIGSISRTPMAASYYGYSGGNINTTGTPSFFFSCSGTIAAVLQYTVDLGSFGSYGFEAQKQ
ncbi:hypothetical protein [Maribacter luteus]|uniref:Uncharacterized protein n=1 Tax=Maribacter luteus TaxID=2594478 RepID=A0A6I2MHG8_9FLAO|nr:hypothetical protein [Maribacter luteus]MRX63253.1 hypothetical protein [Maribacter luteus]